MTVEQLGSFMMFLFLMQGIINFVLGRHIDKLVERVEALEAAQ